MKIHEMIRDNYPEWLHDHWPSMIVDAMKFCLTLKYKQSEAFRAELERSKGLFIVEDETARTKGRDAADAQWWPINALPKLAFDHDKILADAMRVLKING